MSCYIICRARWVKICGTKYQTPCALIVGRSEDDDEVQFGQVQRILVHLKQVFFEFELMKAEYVSHVHAYAVKPSRQCFIIEYSHLLDYHPYGMYHCRNLSSDSSVQFTVLRCSI